VTERRAIGALEQEVLASLWAADSPATPAEVLRALDDDLAYTTVMTILTRLWDKGLVTRTRKGRAYAYAPTRSEAELAAERMHNLLAAASDRKAALTEFVGSLPARDARTLRALIEETDRPKRRR
jgi:predicted transcriptional regulator